MLCLIACLAASSLVFGGWQSEQIEADLAAFPVGSLKKERLKEALQNAGELNMYAEVAHIEIRGSKVRVKNFVTTGFGWARVRLAEVVRDLARWQKKMRIRPSRLLPNSEFLLSVGDGIDIDKYKAYLNPEALSVPVFVFCKRGASKKLVLFPDHGALARRGTVRKAVRRGNSTYPWDKKEGMLFWRGRGTDGIYEPTIWRERPRAKLVLMAKKSSQIDAGFTDPPEIAGEGVVHDLLVETGGMKSFISPKEHMRYKYLMDIDGHSNGWDRCFWGLLSNSALFKQQSEFSQWYYRALVPNRDFVPVAHDLSDLEEKIAWAKAHDKHLEQVAENGKRVAEEIFSKGAVYGYIQELLTEYNRRFEK